MSDIADLEQQLIQLSTTINAQARRIMELEERERVLMAEIYRKERELAQLVGQTKR